MLRHLIIDNRSGYIVGDTADPRGRVYQIDEPIDACRRLSGTPLLRVTTLGSHDAGYRVYLATDYVPPITNPRHAHVIELIEQECPCVAMFKITSS